MKALLLSKEAIQSALPQIPAWEYINNGLEAHFVFQDFNAAWAFLTQVALLSEQVDHHAEYSGVYNKVHLRLSTHSAGGVTQKDVDFAVKCKTFIVRH